MHTILLLLLSFGTQSQELKINEWLKENPPPERKFNFLFQLDNRQSFVFDKPVKFSGLRIGLEYKQVHDFGLGFYSPINPVRIKYTKPEFRDDSVDLEAAFRYTTIFYQYALFHNDHWEIATPIHLGRGRANVRVIDGVTDSLVILPNGRPELDERRLPFTISEIGLDVQYKYDWLGVGGGVGYRFLLVGDERQRHLFDGATYAFKIKILFGEVYKRILRHYSYEGTYLRNR